MNTKQLQYFLATAKQKSISRAAKELDIAQPAISLQIANLEHELKVKLFERDFKGMKLTESGQKFETHAADILSKIQAAKLDITENKEDYSGKVVVGLSQSICNVLSVDLLNELEHRYPNIELTFRVGPSYIVDTWLSNNEVDIALCYQDSEHINYEQNTIELIREDLFLYISEKPQNPNYSELVLYSSLPFSDLQHYEIFMPDQKDALSKTLVQTAQQTNIKLKTKDGFGQMMTTLHFVTQGLGLVVCPSSSTFHLERCKQIRAIKLIEPNLQQRVFLVKAKQTSPVEAVYELIREVTANINAKEDWRGSLSDKKYHRAHVVAIDKFVEG